METYWEFQQSKNEWIKFSSEINKKLNTSKNSVIELKIDSKTVNFDFEQMKQKNSRIFKDIRCIVVNESKEIYDFFI